MARYPGGTKVRGGYYWNPRTWTVVPVGRDGGGLPGGAGDRWMRMPLLAVIFLLPVLGGLFVVFLPFIGFALFLHAIARMAVGAFRKGAAHLASTVTPGWRPGEAHLTGKRAPGDREVPGKSEAMEKLAKEISERREGQED
jgi:hypothetical protein